MCHCFQQLLMKAVELVNNYLQSSVSVPSPLQRRARRRVIRVIDVTGVIDQGKQVYLLMRRLKLSNHFFVQCNSLWSLKSNLLFEEAVSVLHGRLFGSLKEEMKNDGVDTYGLSWPSISDSRVRKLSPLLKMEETIKNDMLHNSIHDTNQLPQVR